MIRFTLAVLAATVTLFAWGFLYWALSPLPMSAVSTIPDEEPVRTVLREGLPEAGMYVLPKGMPGEDGYEERYEEGPVGVLYVEPQGRPFSMVGPLLHGLLNNFVTALVLCTILLLVRNGLPRIGGRILFFFLIGLAAAVFVNWAALIWWHQPVLMTLYQMVFTISAFTFVGLVASVILPAGTRAVSGPAAEVEPT